MSIDLMEPDEERNCWLGMQRVFVERGAADVVEKIKIMVREGATNEFLMSHFDGALGDVPERERRKVRAIMLGAIRHLRRELSGDNQNV